jgi:coronin-1B/1C/6
MPSKFKNAIGQDQKEIFTDCNVSTASTEGRLIAVNNSFLAMAWANVGEIVVVDSSKPCRMKLDQPRIKGRRSNVLDLEFSPFSSDLLASAYDDCAILLHQIPKDGLTTHMTKELQIYHKHSKKVPLVTFNPIASDVISSGAFSGEIHIWNALKADSYCELKADETPTWLQWSPNGALLGCTTKNKFMNIFDARSKNMTFKKQITEGFQASKFTWIDNEQFAVVGWNKLGNKELKLWDVRNQEKEVTLFKIDNSKTVSTPYVDRESQLLYVIGKGENSTHIFDYSEGKFIKGINYSSKEPSICSVMFERRCMDYNKLEVDRFARYVNSHKVYYVSFSIPRRNPGYDPTLYPPVDIGEAVLTYDEWVSGKNGEAKKKPIDTIENKFVSKIDEKQVQKATTEEKTVTKTDKSNDDKIKELKEKYAQLTSQFNQLNEENAKLKKELESLG